VPCLSTRLTLRSTPWGSTPSSSLAAHSPVPGPPTSARECHTSQSAVDAPVEKSKVVGIPSGRTELHRSVIASHCHGLTHQPRAVQLVLPYSACRDALAIRRGPRGLVRAETGGSFSRRHHDAEPASVDPSRLSCRWHQGRLGARPEHNDIPRGSDRTVRHPSPYVQLQRRHGGQRILQR
jgi:hypothetical protein